MLAEAMVRSGHALVRRFPPEGREYWSARFWDRAEAESRPFIGDDFRTQKDQIAGLLERHADKASQVLEFACGTGEFTAMAVRLTPATTITATDISQHALDMAAQRPECAKVEFVRGDFWADGAGLLSADLVMCIDAIHHLGDVRAALRRLKSYVAPGGLFIGNLWTLDNFHEYQRQRYGSLRHLGRSGMFLLTAVGMRLSGGRLRTSSYRTQLLHRQDIGPLLEEVFGEVLEMHNSRYFTCFAVRP